MPLFMKKTSILAKVETTAGTDSVPTGAANAMLVRNVSLMPLEQELEERNLTAAYLGNADSVVVASWNRLDFEVELAGAGAAGTAPKWGPLLRACAFSETVLAGTSVTYSPVSGVFDRLTIYVNVDGVLHKLTYAAGNVAFSLDARKVPFLKFSFTGFFIPVADQVVPTPNYNSFVKPLAVNKANTPTFQLLGQNATLAKLQIDMGNQVAYRNLVNHESVQITDRKPVGSVSTEAVAVATRDIWSSVSSGSSGLLQIVHGTAAGNIIDISSAKAQLIGPRYSALDGIAMFDAQLKFTPNGGNDDIVIVVR